MGQAQVLLGGFGLPERSHHSGIPNYTAKSFLPPNTGNKQKLQGIITGTWPPLLEQLQPINSVPQVPHTPDCEELQQKERKH